MTDAEIIAEFFGCPCNYSPIDEEMCVNCDCEHFCGTSEQTDAKCWQRYFDLKRKEDKEMTKAEERALVAYPPRYAKCIIFPETTGADFNTLKREAYQEGYEQAEKDLTDAAQFSSGPDGFYYGKGYEQAEKVILSKFTKEHLEGLKWIERTGISTQPIPYHKYCKDLYKVLEELLKEKYDIQGDTNI